MIPHSWSPLIPLLLIFGVLLILAALVVRSTRIPPLEQRLLHLMAEHAHDQAQCSRQSTTTAPVDLSHISVRSRTATPPAPAGTPAGGVATTSHRATSRPRQLPPGERPTPASVASGPHRSLTDPGPRHRRAAYPHVARRSPAHAARRAS